MRSFLPLLLILLVFCIQSQAQWTWYPANNPYAANVIDLREAPNGDFLCGTNRGLFKSTDGGASWSNISGQYPYLAAGGIAITSNSTYVATFGPFMQRSTDGGQSWTSLAGGSWTSSSTMVTNSSGDIFIRTNSGVWRSADNGDNWTQLTIGGMTNQVASIEIAPDDDLFVGGFNKKVYRSTDNGDNWTEIFSAPNDFYSMAFDGNSTVYGITRFSGIFKSTDNGATWDTMSPVPGNNGGFDINVNSTGDVFLAAYDDPIFKSTDGGASWQDITSDLIFPSIDEIFIPSSNDIYLGTNGAGIQKLMSNSWESMNEGMDAIFIERFSSVGGDLFACTSYGVFISEDGGLTFRQSITGMDDAAIVAVAKAPNGDLYAGGDMLYRSTDNGMTWMDLSSSFPSNDVTCTDILVNSTGRVIMSTEDYGIQYSDDMGQTWSTSNSGLYDTDLVFIREGLNGYMFTSDGFFLYRNNDLTMAWDTAVDGLTDKDVEEFAAGSSTLYAQTYSDGLFKSTDNGDNWSLAIDEDFGNMATNGDTVYGAGGGTTGGNVFYSVDNGSNWTNIGSNLPDDPVDFVCHVPGQGLFSYLSTFGLYTLNFSLVGIEDPVFADEGLKCYPNPFSGSTTLQIELTESAKVMVSIFSLDGKLLESPGPMRLSAGSHEIQIGSNLNSGMYQVMVEANGQAGSGMILKVE